MTARGRAVEAVAEAVEAVAEAAEAEEAAAARRRGRDLPYVSA